MSENNKKKWAVVLIFILLLILGLILVFYVFRNYISNTISINSTKKANWDGYTVLITKAIENNELITDTGYDMTFKLDKVCKSKTYEKPTNITSDVKTIANIDSSDIAIGCYWDGSNISVLAISTGIYGTQYVKKMNFYEGATNVKTTDFIINQKMVKCDLNNDGTISCK